MTEYDGAERSITERLRQLLDDRGVKYKYRDMFGKHVFHWGTPAVNGAMFTDGGKWTELVVENPTPEQAVEATLWRGTCRNVYEKGHFKCSECGHYTQARMVYRDGEPAADPNYCPNCGRRVAHEQ